MKNLTSVVVYSDVHVPYQNKAAHSLFRRMAPLCLPKPSRVVCLGDYLDNYSVSRYGKDPKREVAYQKEIDEAAHELAIDRALIDGPFDFIGGNHERRTQSYVTGNARALHDIRNLQVRELLGMAALDIAYHDQPLCIGNLDFIHGDEENAGAIYPARSMYLKRQGNFVMGHVHRAQRFYNLLADGSYHQAYCNPCLCALSQEYVRGIPQWQTGFSKALFYGRELLTVEQYIFIQKGGYLYGTMDGVLYREPVSGAAVSWSHR